ncbi:MAG: AAA family ATPase [Cellulomonas sp.]
MSRARLAVSRVRGDTDHAPPAGAWFTQIPAVAQLLRDGWDLAPITVLVGDNGAGKSTLVEALARAFGVSAEGGSTGSRHQTRETESDLWSRLVLERDIGAPRRAFFVRAETMHSFYTYLEDNPGGRMEPQFHRMSHGESILALVTDRMVKPGLYLFDEPESALSFTGCLALITHLTGLVADGSQVVLATHSPVLAAMPGADVWEVGEWGDAAVRLGGPRPGPAVARLPR